MSKASPPQTQQNMCMVDHGPDHMQKVRSFFSETILLQVIQSCRYICYPFTSTMIPEQSKDVFNVSIIHGSSVFLTLSILYFFKHVDSKHINVFAEVHDKDDRIFLTRQISDIQSDINIEKDNFQQLLRKMFLDHFLTET